MNLAREPDNNPGSPNLPITSLLKNRWSAVSVSGGWYVLSILLLAGAYFASAKVGLSLASVHTNVSPAWPPTGIAIAAILLLGYRVWPGILLGAFLANLLTPVPVATSAAIAVGNTLEALSAGWLLRSVSFHNSLDRARDVFKFVVTVLICTTISATIGPLSLYVGKATQGTDFGLLWLTWWLGDLAGALTVAPLMLTWCTRSHDWLPRRRYVEAAALILLLSLAAIVTFGKTSPAPVHYYPLTRLIVPFLLWAAFRLGRRGVTVAVVVMSVFAVWGTAQGEGPFISGSANNSLLLLQLFLGSNAVTFLFLGAVVEERRRSDKTRRENEQRLVTNLAVTRILAESPDLGDAMPRILQTIGETLGWQVGCMWALDSSEKVLRNLNVWRAADSKADKFEAVCRERTFAPGIGLPGRVWTGLRPAWIPDVTKDDNFPRSPLAVSEGLHAAFAFPIMFGEKFLGIVEFFSSEIREPDEPLLAMVGSIGNQIGQFIERKNAEEALLQNREWLRLTMEGSRMGTWTRELDGTNHVRWSPELERIFGLEPGEFSQTEEAFFDFVHPEDRQPLAKAVARAIETHSDYEIEFRYKQKGGASGWMLGRGRAFYNDAGRPYRLAGLGWDISERKQIEEALEFASRLPEENPAPVIRLNQGRTLSYANPAAQHVLAKWDLVLGTEAPREIVETACATLAHGNKCDIELPLGNRTYFVTFAPVCHAKYVNLYFTDITDRKRAEESLVKNQEALRLAHKVARGGTWQWDLLTNTVNWSQEYYELLGLDPAKVPASFDEWSRRVHPDHLATVLEEHENAIKEKRDVDVEFQIQRADGEWRWFHRTGRCVYGPDGRPQSVIGITFDITERRQAQEATRLFASIVKSTDDAIIAKDLNGVITSWNPGAEKLYGYKAEEVIGKPIGILMPPERPDEEPAILAKLRRGERIDHYETVRVARDGRRIHVSLTVSPIKDASGAVIGASKIARDISEQRRAQEERERLLERERAAREEAEIANRTKDEFLAVLSHELRTPLTAMLGWLSILRGHRLDQKMTEHAIETIQRNAQAQAQLIEDLVDVSRIVGGKLNLEVRPIDLLPVINAAIEVVRPAADAKSIRIEIDHDSTVGPVFGDPARLQQVIWNLLSNAVKFTPKGGSIYVNYQRAESAAEIVIRDTGVGIPADFLPHVFERFRQADSAVTRSHRGMGLGLAIVRHLVELHGGTVTAMSRGENQGATFAIQLPLAAVTQPTLASAIEFEPADAADGRLNGIRILLVEDEPDARELITLALKRSGADVEAVDSAHMALRRLQFFTPDVLLSDIGLPVESGYDLIRSVRALSSDLNKMPAIALTAFATENDRQMSISAGFHAHLAKPVEPSQLIETIKDLVNGNS